MNICGRVYAYISNDSVVECTAPLFVTFKLFYFKFEYFGGRKRFGAISHPLEICLMGFCDNLAVFKTPATPLGCLKFMKIGFTVAQFNRI